jgi:hypothetical protein
LALNEGGYFFRIRSTWTSSFDLPSVTYLTVQILGSIISIVQMILEILDLPFADPSRVIEAALKNK